jgi:hypothetical protein
MAGLLAETGLTLREDEAAALRTLATTASAELDEMLLSADGFCAAASSDLTVELRRDLLDRLGLIGLRLVIEQLRAGRVASASELSRVLIEASGLADLRTVIEQRFLPQAQTLKARSAIAALRDIARSFAATDPAKARVLDAEIERVESAISDFAELRVAHLVLSGTVALTPDETAEVERATAPGSSDEARLNAAAGATADERRASALAAVGQWRTRGSDPLNDSALVEVCDTLARTYEGIYVRAL